MSLIEFIQLLLRNKKWVILFPLLVGIMVIFLSRNMPHSYSSDMVIYTGIASGYNIENDIDGKIDYHEANSKFDNLINTITSKETRKEVSMRFLSEYIIYPDSLIGEFSKLYQDHFEWLSDTSFLSHVRGKSEIETMDSLGMEIQKGKGNPYYQLVYGSYENPFNLNTLDKIKAMRLGFSDMVKLEYTSENALVTKKTLDLLSEVFLSKYKGMRLGEVTSVVKYFMEQTSQALERLKKAELSLKDFKTENRVINYYEQTRYIADQKDDFDKRKSTLQMDLEGYQSALRKVESKLNNHFLIQLKSDQVLQAKNELSTQYNSMGLALVKGEIPDAENAEKLDKLKSNLKENIQGLYEINNSTEGLPGKELLDQWLESTISLEMSKSKLVVLEKNKKEFEKVYDHFAPLGSDLSKLERDVDVAEKEYLNLLHNLNQAKLKERNLVVTENISITDPPDLPATANSSKRMLLLIVSVLSCLVIVIVVLMLREYLDESISNPKRFSKITGIKVATAFANNIQNSNINISEVNNLSNERWIHSLLDLENRMDGRSVSVVAAPLHRSVVDLNPLFENLSRQLMELKYNWEIVTPDKLLGDSQKKIVYVNNNNREMLDKEVMQNCSMLYLIVNATLRLDEYHCELIENWKQLNIPVQAVLVNTKIHNLEKFLGEIPKNRSRLRKFIKSFVRRYSK